MREREGTNQQKLKCSTFLARDCRTRRRQAQLQKNGFMGSIMQATMEANNGKVESQLVETVQQVHTETSLSASHLAA